MIFNYLICLLLDRYLNQWLLMTILDVSRSNTASTDCHSLHSTNSTNSAPTFPRSWAWTPRVSGSAIWCPCSSPQISATISTWPAASSVLHLLQRRQLRLDGIQLYWTHLRSALLFPLPVLHRRQFSFRAELLEIVGPILREAVEGAGPR